MLLALALASLDVLRKLDHQATATSDNVQWTLTQVEVEYRRLEAAVAKARAEGGAPAALAELRRRFDVFYARISAFDSGVLRDALADLPGDGSPQRIRAALDDAVPLIDADDARLAARLEALGRDIDTLARPVREIAVGGIDSFARITDDSRRAVTATLTRTAIVTLALVAALLGMVVWALRMWRDARLLAEEAHEASARYAAILSSSLDAVLATDADGRIQEFNPAAEKLFGHPRDEAVGCGVADLLVPSHLRDRVSAAMARTAAGEPGALPRGRVTGRAQRRDGSSFPVEMSVSTAHRGRDTIFVIFLCDITARRQAETELLRARDDALAGEKAKADLLMVMSHEMRTPLNGLLGTMELMRDGALDAEQREHLRIMETSGRLLLSHVNDVLDVSRLDAGKVELQQEIFELGQLLHEVADGQRGLAEANGDTLAVALDPALPGHVLGDCGRLRQIVLNLVGNAVKFTRDGAVTVEAEAAGPGQVEIRVIDTGIGMSEADLARIFDDFVTLDTSYSRTSGGTGLGLGIVRRLVQAMGGEIGAQSAPGEGSLFWLRLPLPEAAAPGARPAAANAAPAAGTARRVLVVEDNEINRVVVGEMLRRAGHSVRFAHDGEAGVQAAQAAPVDVILMDISMPRMDGVAATRAIRAGDGPNRRTPIVALTAHALPADIARFHAAGMREVITKPLSRAALDRLMAGLGAAPGPDAPPDPAPAALPLIDTAARDAFFADLGRPRAAALLGEFLDTTAASMAEIARNGSALPLPRLVTELHRIASAAGLCGASALCVALRELETLGKTGAEIELRAGLPALQELWRRTEAELAPLRRDAA
ncbi:PAS domain S-box-containing protein [Limimaricola pyoseonensis]|uniref:histidine kinase n=2 Tax=Limimaricola pyoseonensis TaxID=521013 RepID=A0A1G7I906_9RHOB|nr:PAS domain S-box-containing protein [Limimaricola pyoseonensis]